MDSLQKFKLSDILPNPWRNLAANPLREEKLISLKESIEETGFWKNIVVRINKQGNPELAYGHHRVEAAKRAGITEHYFVVEKLSDSMMLKIMDKENRDEFGNKDLLALMESIEAVVNALAAGSIPKFEHSDRIPNTNLYYAPSFVLSKKPSQSTDQSQIEYTALDVAKFLGRTYKTSSNPNGQASIRYKQLCVSFVMSNSGFPDGNEKFRASGR